MNAPKLFGLPLYRNMKHRVANKYIKYFWRGRSLNSNYWNEWSRLIGSLKVGDLFFSCMGHNRRITYIEPHYIGIGNGQILVDVDIGDHFGGSCSLKHCGPGAAMTRDEVEQYRQHILSRPDARDWNWDIAFSPDVMVINDDGTVNVNHELEKQLFNERNANGR